MPSINKTKYYNTWREARFNYFVVPKEKKYPDWAIGTSLVSSADSRTDGGPVPGYKLKIRSGENATSSLNGVLRQIEPDMGLIAFGRQNIANPQEWVWNYVNGCVLEYLNPGNASVDDVSPTAVNEAIRNFTRKCLQEQTAFNSGPFLGELRESLRMIKSPAQALRRGVDEYVREARRRVKRTSRPAIARRVLSGTWLEYQFGWKPLISDITDGAVALAGLAQTRPPFKMVRAKGSSVDPISTSYDDCGVGALVIPRTTIGLKESTVVYRGVVKLNCTPGISMSAQNLGFRWDQFVPTVWELIPYSFLVDYFTNVGDILQSWSYASSNMKWASKTVIVEREFTRTAGSPYWTGSLAGLRTEWKNTSRPSRFASRAVARTPTVGSMVPTLELRLPDVGSLKWLNLASLAGQRRL